MVVTLVFAYFMTALSSNLFGCSTNWILLPIGCFKLNGD
ncbi:unnamed protein product [Acidithrix sp. C25]|nr:unnamed protein product [Acidithrix sp. C25]CAG4934282.1 unnamed protein product [Acidithrix sp. C25]